MLILTESHFKTCTLKNSKEGKIVLGCVIALCLITCKLLTQNKAKSV